MIARIAAHPPIIHHCSCSS